MFGTKMVLDRYWLSLDGVNRNRTATMLIVQAPVGWRQSLARFAHTVYESKNGLGPAPIKTSEGWLQLAHGVRGTAAGLRYVLYAFMTALDEPSRLIHEPGGYLLAPSGIERVGDVSNVTFSNGWVARSNGHIPIYYASSDTRCHVAATTVEKLVDYCKQTPRDPLRSAACVQQRIDLIRRNLGFMGANRLAGPGHEEGSE